jgi:diguanylate cyclase (GGDEF)-like protein
MLLNARKIYSEVNNTQLILLAIADITERKDLEEKLKTLASHDELTGCINFRSIMKVLENEIERSKRYQKNFVLIMLDIDQLKMINDEYGHLAGNDALVTFTNVIRNSVRNIDVVGRYGGDEFMVVLPETNPHHALVVLERIRKDLNQTKIISPHVENAREFTLTFSAGVADFPDNAKDLEELIWIADNALRQAKQEGKNRTVLEKRKPVE